MEEVTAQVMTLKSGRISSTDQELIQGFLDDCRLRIIAPGSITSYRSILGTVSQLLGDKGLSLTDLNKQTLKIVLRYFGGTWFLA